MVEENRRTLEAGDALMNKDFDKLGALLYEAHNSLSFLYEVSCEELDFLVNFAKQKEYVAGARMMGGGFGGCTLNLIKTDKAEQFVEAISEAYLQKTGISLMTYPVSLGGGASARSL